MSEKQIDRFIYNSNDKIGEGSFGKVYKGRDRDTNQQVAIKMIPKAIINQDEYLREGLMSEIKIMQKLKSPNAVQLIDVLETANNYYIVQEFCNEGDLSHYLQKKGPLGQESILKFYVDILMGFLELVRNGIMHRDLKPANILINQGVYKLADFGFAKCADNFQKQMFTSAVGTPLYMSPQILRNEKYSSKSDIWSLGMVFYEAYYGKTPWTARSIPELLSNLQKIPVSFPNTKPVDQEVKNFLTGCLQYEECNRLSWDQVFRHKLFGNAFQKYVQDNEQLEDKANYLINDLRQHIIQKQIDLEKLFLELDITGDMSLSQNEFSKLLLGINDQLTREEIEYVFNKFDEDGNNQIEFDEFRKWLEQNNVRMSIIDKKQSFQKLNTIELPQKQNPIIKQDSFIQQPQQPTGQYYQQVQAQQSSSQDYERGGEIIIKLKMAIHQYNINLWELFKKYDKSDNQSLDLQEFIIMIKQYFRVYQYQRRIDHNLMDGDIQSAFKMMDVQKRGEITFQEFNSVLSGPLNIPVPSPFSGSGINSQPPNQYWGQGSQGYQQQQQQQQYPPQQFNQSYPNQQHQQPSFAGYPNGYQQQQNYHPQQPQQPYYNNQVGQWGSQK